jgi:hypothetical protein
MLTIREIPKLFINKIFMKTLGNVILVIVGALLVVFLMGRMKPEEPTPAGDADTVTEEIKLTSIKGIEIFIETPKDGGVVTNPLTVRGRAPGNWFFEANAGLTLTNWDGLIIAESYVMAEGEWMTTDYVPFSGTITFEEPFCADGQEYCKRGTLIFKKDNPSGEPQFDDAAEMTVWFQ